VHSFCFPFNCAGKNTGAGTNANIVAEWVLTTQPLRPKHCLKLER